MIDKKNYGDIIDSSSEEFNLWGSERLNNTVRYLVDAMEEVNPELITAQLSEKADKDEVNILATDKADLSFVTSSLAQKVTQDDVITITANKADISYVDSKTAAVASGSPNGVYATLTDLQTAYPTGDTRIKLVTSDGKWYYWNGTAWTAGAVYQSSGLPASSLYFEQWLSDEVVEINSGAAPGTILVFDSFNRANSAILGVTETGSKTWVEPATRDGLLIENNKVKCSVAGSIQHAYVDAGATEIEISTTVVFGTYAGIIFRWTDTSNGFFFKTGGGNTMLGAYKNSTTSTALGTNPYVPTGGQTCTLKVKLQGENIKCYIDDTLYFDLNDSFDPLKKNVGIIAHNDNTTLFDDFKVVAL